MITYEFDKNQEGVNKVVVAKTEIFEKDDAGKYVLTETREERFTIRDLEDQIARLEQQKTAWGEQIAKLQAKIAEVKKALAI